MIEEAGDHVVPVLHDKSASNLHAGAKRMSEINLEPREPVVVIEVIVRRPRALARNPYLSPRPAFRRGVRGHESLRKRRSEEKRERKDEDQ